jgi:hypothetical protein
LRLRPEEMKMAVGRLKQLSADERTRMIFEARQLYLMDECFIDIEGARYFETYSGRSRARRS